MQGIGNLLYAEVRIAQEHTGFLYQVFIYPLGRGAPRKVGNDGAEVFRRDVQI